MYTNYKFQIENLCLFYRSTGNGVNIQLDSLFSELSSTENQGMLYNPVISSALSKLMTS